jgi:protein-disulfide isomerase
MAAGMEPRLEDTEGGSLRQGVLSTLSAAALITVCVVLWQVEVRPTLRSATAEFPVPLEARLLDLLHLKGARHARVALLVFSDFQCPACATLARDVLPTVVEKYVATGRVLLAFGDLPLEAVHSAALRRAAIAECAARQGRFWSVHDRLFAGQAAPSVEQDAVEGLDGSTLAECLSLGSAEAVRARRVVAEALGVTSTPSLCVGELEGGTLLVTEAVVGLRNVRQLSAMLDRHLIR